MKLSRKSDFRHRILWINNLKCNIFRLYLITIPTKNYCYHYGKQVAQLMAEMRVNSAVVCEANVPIGIVTDTDMSSKIATGPFQLLLQ
jgi:predicted transcriptional regulator